MHAYLKGSFRLLLATASVSLQMMGQESGPPRPAAQAERAALIQKLGDEIRLRTPEDGKRVTSGYTEEHLSQIRKLVQDQVLQTLGRSDSPEGLRSAMQAVLGPKPYFSEGPVAYAAALHGVATVVTAYDWEYGGFGIPAVRAVIDGYRKVGLSYQLTAEAGQTLDGCGLRLVPLESPRPDEAWLLARGSIVGASRASERMRVYSFDGYAFKELWSSGEIPIDDPSVKVSKESVSISYSQGLYRDRFKEALQLTIAGVVASPPEPLPPVVK